MKNESWFQFPLNEEIRLIYVFKKDYTGHIVIDKCYPFYYDSEVNENLNVMFWSQFYDLVEELGDICDRD